MGANRQGGSVATQAWSETPRATTSTSAGHEDDLETLYVTRPDLPPLEKLIPLLEEIWERRVLSNAGPLHERLEAALSTALGVEHLSLCVNGTLGLVLALKLLPPREKNGKRGQVITSPFTFVGTAEAIEDAGFEPVFADIQPGTFLLDPDRVEEAITDDTCAVLPVHCFGHAANVGRFAEISSRHGIGLVYDAAHAFGVDDAGGSLLRHGDASVVSLHATKTFQTFEGGFSVFADRQKKVAFDRMRAFGIVDRVAVTSGTNAKMNEFSAALGLLQLDRVELGRAARKERDALYRELLGGVAELEIPEWPSGQTANYHSFPILVRPEARVSARELKARLHEQKILVRRYFHPLVSDLPMYRRASNSGNPPAALDMPVARAVSERILCLPLYADLPHDAIRRVVGAITSLL